jgi:phospholipid/cholesterol/gamma-HCH transport system substrate-binding protein
MPDEEKAGLSRTTHVTIWIGSAVVLTVLLAVVIIRSGFRRHNLMVTSYFANAGGLKSGAAVNLDGVTIGTVKSVTLTTSQQQMKTPIKVVMKLDSKYQSNLHVDSTATILSLGALGDTAIDIDSREAVGPILRDGDDLKAIVNPSVLDAKVAQETIDKMNVTEGKLNALVDQVESGKGSIGQLMSNPGLTNEASATVSKVREVTGKLNSNTNSLGKFVGDRSVTDRIGRIGTDVEGVSASLAKVTGGPLQANLAVTQTHVASLTADMNAGEGAVGVLKKDSPMGQQMSAATGQAKTLIAGIGDGKGSAGKIVAGGDVSANLTKLATESGALAMMIRQNPTKYLTIQVRIF